MVVDLKGENLTVASARYSWALIQQSLGIAIRSVHMGMEICRDWENEGLVHVESRPISDAWSNTFLGLDLVIDRGIQENELQFRDDYGNLLGSIINIGCVTTTVRPYRRIKS